MAVPIGKIAFDSANPAALAWARLRSAMLVRQISEETRLAIRAIIARCFQDFLIPTTAAKLLRSVVGLTRQQAEAVDNLRRAMIANPGKRIYAGKTAIRVPSVGADAALIDQRCREYAERLRNKRAVTIARTETVSASCEGQRQLWLQGAEQGIIDLDTDLRKWITVPEGMRPCETCAPMNGQLRRIDEPFITPDGEEIFGPAAHPNCRCAVGLVPNALAPKAARAAGGKGSGNFGHAGRPGEVGGSAPHGEGGGVGGVGGEADVSFELSPMDLDPMTFPHVAMNIRDKLSSKDPDIAEALSIYSGAGYAAVNSSLRGTYIDAEDLEACGIEDSLDDVVASLDDVVASLDDAFVVQTAEEIDVYRGISTESLWDFKAGQVFTDQGFVSTTASKSVARKFGADMLHIQLPKGTHVALPCCKALNEREVLLPRGSRFRVDRVDGRDYYMTYLGTTDNPTTLSAFATSRDRLRFESRIADADDGDDVPIDPRRLPRFIWKSSDIVVLTTSDDAATEDAEEKK